mmetsp:Transcript_13384/g.42173  ORF Transcript_13384/g.42173 Transcript_13384/m.42173 type:complete len:201 (-) Transcript_13384:463-1065(-)
MFNRDAGEAHVQQQLNRLGVQCYRRCCGGSWCSCLGCRWPWARQRLQVGRAAWGSCWRRRTSAAGGWRCGCAPWPRARLGEWWLLWLRRRSGSGVVGRTGLGALGGTEDGPSGEPRGGQEAVAREQLVLVGESNGSTCSNVWPGVRTGGSECLCTNKVGEPLVGWGEGKASGEGGGGCWPQDKASSNAPEDGPGAGRRRG